MKLSPIVFHLVAFVALVSFCGVPALCQHRKAPGFKESSLPSPAGLPWALQLPNDGGPSMSRCHAAQSRANEKPEIRLWPLQALLGAGQVEADPPTHGHHGRQPQQGREPQPVSQARAAIRSRCVRCFVKAGAVTAEKPRASISGRVAGWLQARGRLLPSLGSRFLANRVYPEGVSGRLRGSTCLKNLVRAWHG